MKFTKLRFRKILKLLGGCGLIFALTTSVSAQTPVIANGEDYTLMIDATGKMFSWGSNGTGQLGAGIADAYSPTAQLVGASATWLDVAASKGRPGSGHVLAIQSDGSLWAWGDNTRGQLGVGTFGNTINEPTLVDATFEWAEVAVGQEFSMARTVDGEVFIWGDNTFGQLARTIYDISPGTSSGVVGSPLNIHEFPDFLDGNTYEAIAAGDFAGLAIRSGGALYSWGTGAQGQLGRGSQTLGPSLTPTQVGSNTDWTDLFAGTNLAVGIRNGDIYLWGSSLATQFGFVPTPLANDPAPSVDWVSISIGANHSLALKADGRLYGIGSNDNGQLGLPLVTSGGSPILSNYYLFDFTQLLSGQTFSAVGVGDSFSTLIREDGSILAAGLNTAGRLGNGIDGAGAQYSFEVNSVGGVDLFASSLTVSQELLEPGTVVDTTLVVENLGTGTLTDSFDVEVQLNTTGGFRAFGAVSLTFEGGSDTFTVTDDIAAGESISIPLRVEIPSSINRGDYFLVMKVDSDLEIEESNEDNNDVGTEETYEFYPDLIFTDTTGVELQSPAASYEPGDNMTINVNIENVGAGNLAADSNFEIRVFLSPTQNVDDAAAIDLESELLTVSDAITAGTALATIVINVQLPEGLPSGDYYLNGVVDVTNVVSEQSEFQTGGGTILREDGEQNNVFFGATTNVTVVGIDLAVAMDQPTLTFDTSGDGQWFGQQTTANFGGSAAQSPELAAGQTAVMSTFFEDSVLIQFDWRASTTNVGNTLSYSVIGGPTDGGVNSISGDTGWITDVSRVVAGGSEVLWTYSSATASETDAVFVDNLRIIEVTEPDLVVSSIDLRDNETGLIVDSGSYVLMRDRLNLNLNLRNQGQATAPTDSFVVSVYLSKDRNFDRPDGNPATVEDVLIAQLSEDQVFDTGSASVQAPSIDLPEDLEGGSYYVIAYIDDFTDADGNLLPGAAVDVGQVDEFVDGTFDGEANNLFIAETPAVEIRALPDLTVTAVNVQRDPTTQPDGIYLVTDTQGNPTRIDFDFTIANEGLSGVEGDVRIRVLVSPDVDLDPDTDALILEYIYDEGLSAGTSRQVQPDLVQIPNNLPIGELLYFGVFIDALNEIEELDEANNGKNYFQKDFLFSEVSLEQAVELDVQGNVTVVNNPTPLDEEDLPWVGLASGVPDSFDGIDAAMSSNIGDDSRSYFETSVSLPSDTFVTFQWKVSSQNNEFGTDALKFYVDDFSPLAEVASIAGETGWRRVSVFVEAGDHIFRWSYEKDSLISLGQDRGWVDQIAYQTPNLTVTDVAVNDLTPSYGSGDPIDEWSVTVTNNLITEIPTSPAVVLQVRMSSTNTWADPGADEYTLLTITDSQGFAVGESRTYTQDEFGPLTVPPEISLTGNYYLGAYVDWNPINPATGQIPESNETDNVRFTDTSVLDISPAKTLEQGVDYPDPFNPITDDPVFEVEGASGWYGLDSLDAQVDGDLVRSGLIEVGEKSSFKAVVEGPSVLSFQWKIASEGANNLAIAINGVVQNTLIGDVDWEAIEVFVPGGTQEISWTYNKSVDSGESQDAAFVDGVEFTPYLGDELALTSVNYTAGEYILDVIGGPEVYLGTEFFEITVEAENQGNDLVGGTFSVADVEVRLSTDQIYGNADDVILGSFSSVDSTLNPEGGIDSGFSSGGVLRFIGPIELGDHIPEDNYYVIAKIDTNEELTEYDEENNLFISENRDVIVTRLPALRIVNPDYALDEGTFSTAGPSYLDPTDGADTSLVLDESLFRYDRSPLRLQFGIQNVGLDRLEGSAVWTNEVTLRGVLRTDLQTQIDAVDLAAVRDLLEGGPSVSLGEFTVQELMEGRSEAKPTGDTINVDLEFALPTDAVLNAIIPDDTSIGGHLWFIEVRLDTGGDVEQSEIVSPDQIFPSGLSWYFVGLTEVLLGSSDTSLPNTDFDEGLFGINNEVFALPTTQADWATLYSVAADASTLFDYAFNRNPANGDTVGGQFPGSYGVTEVDGDEFLSITFDLLPLSTDLTYTVQADDDPGFPSPDELIVIDPSDVDGPYDDIVGEFSLTGDGGLVDQPNVLSVQNQGYTARVTIGDVETTDTAPVRFIRVVVNGTSGEEVPDPGP